MKLVVMCLAGVILVGQASQVPPIRHEDTQLGMIEAEHERLKDADTEMAKVLDALRQKASGNADARSKLDAAQRAWQGYRDAQVNAMWPFPQTRGYGSVNSMCVALSRTRLTEIRIAELRVMLERADGDVCNPTWPE